MPHTLTGNFRFHKAFHSRFVKDKRDIIVYLPPDYDSALDRRYPVCYLHDGQNLFDAETAFNHQEWGLDEIAEQLILNHEIEPLIIAGIYNTPNRVNEYTHVQDHWRRGGFAGKYGKAIIEHLKPFIDTEYRTLPDAQNTALGGSSLGGLVTMYLGLRHPQVFGKLIVMSPAVWWAKRDILAQVRKLRKKPEQRIWLDVGTCEGRNAASCVRDARDLRDALLAKGWQLNRDLRFFEDEGAAHNESAWGGRIHDALKFLFPCSPAITGC